MANPVGLDNSPFNLLTKSSLTASEKVNLSRLLAELEKILASEPACPGDGNLDKKVNEEDIQSVIDNWGQPSVFDFNNDGTTDVKAIQIIETNFGDVCFPVWRAN